jgi:hypothetical protein
MHENILAIGKSCGYWDTDAEKAIKCKASRYADFKTALSDEGWDFSLHLIKVRARGIILKLVKGCLQLLFRTWVPPGHRTGIGQIIGWIFLVCSFAIFQACSDPDWFYPHLFTQHIDGVPAKE